MAVKFEKVKAGAVLYARWRTKMGNTTMSTLSEWDVRVLEVDATKRRVFASWNGNRPEWRGEDYLRKLYTWSMRDPRAEVRRGICGSVVSVKLKKAAKP